jgi:hypothetical protein
MAIGNILWPFGIFHGHLVYFMAIWYICWLVGIFFLLGILYQEKSGNPGSIFSKFLEKFERKVSVLESNDLMSEV